MRARSERMLPTITAVLTAVIATGSTVQAQSLSGGACTFNQPACLTDSRLRTRI